MRKKYISVPLPPKMKVVDFKILFEIYQIKGDLSLRFLDRNTELATGRGD